MPKYAFSIQADVEQIIIRQGESKIVVPLEQVPDLISELAHAIIGATRGRLDREVIMNLGLLNLPVGDNGAEGS